MQNRTLIIASALLAVSAVVVTATRIRAAEPPQSPAPTNRVIRVSGTSVVYAKPDYAMLETGVTKLAPKALEAKAEADAVMRRVQDALRKAGISPDEIQTVAYQMYAVQPKPSAPRQWKVVNHVSVKVRKVQTVAAVLDAAIASGATDVSQVQFGIERVLELRTKARAEAVRVARSKADELAQLTGVHVGDPITISDDSYAGSYAQSSNSYIPLGMSGSAGESVSSGQMSVTARVDVEYGIR